MINDNNKEIDYKKWGITPVTNNQQNNIDNQNIDYDKWGITPAKQKDNTVLGTLKGAGSQILKDIVSLPGGALKFATEKISQIPSGIEFLKEEYPKSLSQMIHNPQRALRNVGAGGMEMIGDIAQTPGALVDYLAHIGMISPETAKKYIRPNQEDISKLADQFVGGGEQPGDVLLRKTYRNLPTLGAIGKVGSMLNPMKMTARNIVKDVMKAKEKNYAAYAGEKGHYTNLFNEARNEGLGQVKYDPKKIRIDDIKLKANPDYTYALDEFLKNPDIELAQTAQSDLKKYINETKKKTNMGEKTRKSYNAAKEAQKHIEDMMFEGSPKLKSQYNKITSGYKKEVIPYTKNKAIKAYEAGEIDEKQLLNMISKKPKITSQHKAIKFRKALPPAAILGLGGYGSYELGSSILKKLLGNNEE